jgi:peptidyl-prolyl cis-trans isomerase A (cyclophilin A)
MTSWSVTSRRTAAGLLAAASAMLAACADSGGEANALARPDDAALSAAAPDSFRVAFETSRGRFVVDANRAWAPRGVDRFHYLVRQGFYDGVRFYRVLPGFIVQFGLHGDPAVSKTWEEREFADDPFAQSNRRGTVTFATAGPNTRTTQLFINTADNLNLDGMGFTPIGTVVEGMDVVDGLYAEYGEGAPDGPGPDQQRIVDEGNAYLTRQFPKLDHIRTARIVEGGAR